MGSACWSCSVGWSVAPTSDVDVERVGSEFSVLLLGSSVGVSVGLDSSVGVDMGELALSVGGGVGAMSVRLEFKYVSARAWWRDWRWWSGTKSAHLSTYINKV